MDFHCKAKSSFFALLACTHIFSCFFKTACFRLFAYFFFSISPSLRVYLPNSYNFPPFSLSRFMDEKVNRFFFIFVLAYTQSTLTRSLAFLLTWEKFSFFIRTQKQEKWMYIRIISRSDCVYSQCFWFRTYLPSARYSHLQTSSSVFLHPLLWLCMYLCVSVSEWDED
jgi:hypothetical protein